MKRHGYSLEDDAEYQRCMKRCAAGPSVSRQKEPQPASINNSNPKMPSYESVIPCEPGSPFDKKHGVAMRMLYERIARHFSCT